LKDEPEEEAERSRDRLLRQAPQLLLPVKRKSRRESILRRRIFRWIFGDLIEEQGSAALVRRKNVRLWKSEGRLREQNALSG
jgi:hypothetical protein